MHTSTCLVNRCIIMCMTLNTVSCAHIFISMHAMKNNQMLQVVSVVS